jgi:hypothetical protein
MFTNSPMFTAAVNMGELVNMAMVKHQIRDIGREAATSALRRSTIRS